DVNSLEHHAADSLPLNAIGRCRVELTASVPLDDYRTSPGTGSFVVIDRLSNITVGAGLIRGAAEGAAIGGEVDWQAFEIEFNALIRKHFPHWEAKNVADLFHR
ncbi:elongation factor 1-alpha C-terminal domain-related protein, partial [Salinicola peritrichatus]|uniref:elongation factor 1-alpha C-terminal domain-related protein n=1 Tax=Salinicola peritrichatus TaxID=1267424 RepID=UPI003B8372AD